MTAFVKFEIQGKNIAYSPDWYETAYCEVLNTDNIEDYEAFLYRPSIGLD